MDIAGPCAASGIVSAAEGPHLQSGSKSVPSQRYLIGCATDCCEHRVTAVLMISLGYKAYGDRSLNTETLTTLASKKKGPCCQQGSQSNCTSHPNGSQGDQLMPPSPCLLLPHPLQPPSQKLRPILETVISPTAKASLYPIPPSSGPPSTLSPHSEGKWEFGIGK